MAKAKDKFEALRDAAKSLKELAKSAQNHEIINLALEIFDTALEIKAEAQSLQAAKLELVHQLRKEKAEIARLNGLLEDYDALKTRLAQYEKHDENLAFYNKMITLSFTDTSVRYSFNLDLYKKELSLPLDQIFKFISLKMLMPVNKWQFIDAFSVLCEGHRVDERQALQLKAHFLALGLIEITGGDCGETIKLSASGFNEMRKLNAFRQAVVAG